MSALIFVVFAAVAGWLFTRFYLTGERLNVYDRPDLGAPSATVREPSAEHFDVLDWLRAQASAARQDRTGGSRLQRMRTLMDSFGDDVDMSGLVIRPADADGVPAEWVLAEGAGPDRRLLYIHGGAWMMGSAKSHRRITSKLSRVTGAAVLAINYRLIPEHHRLACVEDCLSSYRWLLENGPNGKAPVHKLFVAGDSAGGNLALVTIALARDAGLRPADAVVALAPATDGTMSSPSMAANLGTDHMLGPVFGGLAKIPKWILLWAIWLRTFIRPCDPRISPAHGDLARLPPTLVHVSEAEMLLDDARRYVNKAVAAGSPVSLETWPHMLHVWHIFEPTLPEAKEAFEHIARFIEMHAPRQ